jgi:pentatricopeptide repeat protein
VYAHAERADYDGLNFWLQAMSKAGFVPDIYVYSIILKSFAARGEVESVSAVLDQMRAAKILPTRVLYTSVISLLAHRRDPVSAEAIYKRALREGITPDRKMITSLMNAHVEAGSWAGVVRVFDYLKSSRIPRLRLSIEVYNTLLKAYVLIGAPFHVVSTIFRKLESMGVQPNGRMYTLIIQSACDAGFMNIANKIFAEMEAAEKGWQTTYRVDAYVLTIIMAGHLRLGDKRSAKAIYDDMCERGIQPTSATFYHILRAYGNERTEESFQIAEDFLKTIMAGESSASWIHPQTRTAALEHVHGPLMLAYTKADKPEEVERLFQSMLDAGGEPSLSNLTVLLDAYRRAGDIEAIHGLWPQIWQLALRFSKTDSLFGGEDDSPSDPTKRQGNILCVPLSIYIDALSAAGEHFVIAEMWGKARSHGFSFDSHNWNHLAVALVRAGDPERAFEIVERVLLPFERQSEGVLRDRNLSPDSPLTFDVTPADVSKPASQSPMHRSERRAYQSKVATKRSGDALEMDPTSDDFAHPLHVLHQISPSWNVWRPHRAVLDLLSGVLRHLGSGMPVQPVGDHSSTPQALDPDSDDAFTRGNLAREMFDRIHLNYPDTIQAIRLHERWTARKSSLTRQDDGW